MINQAFILLRTISSFTLLLCTLRPTIYRHPAFNSQCHNMYHSYPSFSCKSHIYHSHPSNPVAPACITHILRPPQCMHTPSINPGKSPQCMISTLHSSITFTLYMYTFPSHPENPFIYIPPFFTLFVCLQDLYSSFGWF